MNGTQLYGWSRWFVLLQMGFNHEMRGLPLRKKLALNHLFRESKLTRIENKTYFNAFIPYYPSHAYDRFLKGVKAVCSGYPIPVITNTAVNNDVPSSYRPGDPLDMPRNNPPDSATIGRIIEDAQELGTSVIGIKGGEPLLRNDLEEIIAAVDERSMPILFTTGFGLTPKRVTALKQAGLEIPVISLNHYRPQDHDSGGKEGMFDTALKAIRLFREEGSYVAVSLAPHMEMVKNPKELYRTVRFFKDLGVNHVRLAKTVPQEGASFNSQEESVAQAHTRTIFNLQKMCMKTPEYPGAFAHDYFESEACFGCGAGYNYMYVDARGNVYPCDFTGLSFGNIHDTSLMEIWHETSRAFSAPGRTCYADKCRALLKDINPGKWPVTGEDARQIVSMCPTHDPEQLPKFFRRMGLHLLQRRD